jgi:hypothetical protein
MPTSVVDQVFGRHEPVAPTGMHSQRPLAGAIGKQRAGGGGGGGGPPKLSTLIEQALSPARAAEKAMTDRAVRALSTIEVCTKRLAQLREQFYGPPRSEEAMAFGLLDEEESDPDPDKAIVFAEEEERLRELINTSRDELDAIYRFADTVPPDVGPPLDLEAAAARRRAALQEEMLEERMAGLTTPSMEAEPAQPEQNPDYANSSNTNPHLGGLSDYVHHGGEFPPAYR